MKSKFLIVLYWIIIIVFGTSCEKAENEPDEDAVLTVIEKGASYYSYNGALTPFFEKTLYLFAGEIQSYMRTKLFDVYPGDIVYAKENAIASAVVDAEGKAVFVIDKKYLYGSFARAFSVAVFDQNDQLLAHDWCGGITSGEKREIELNLYFEFVLALGNVEVEVNKQGAIKVRSEIIANSSSLTRCNIATSNYNNLIYDFLGWDVRKGYTNYFDTISSPWIDLDRYGLTLYADAVKPGYEEWDYISGEYVTYPDSVIHVERIISEQIDYQFDIQQGKTYLNIKDNATYTITEAESKRADVIVDVFEDEYHSVQIVIKKASLSRNAAAAKNSNKVYMFQDGQAVDEITYGGIIITEDRYICKLVDVGNLSWSGDNECRGTIQMQIIKEGLDAVTKVDISQLSN